MKQREIQRAKMVARNFIISVFGLYFISGCAMVTYTTEAECNSKTGKECQQGCSRMICTDTSDSKGLSGTGDEDWEYFQRMNEGSFVKILSHTRQYTLLMQKRDGRLYLIMEGNRVLIIPGYNGPTVALPPNGRCFTPVTYDVLEKEGFQCSNTIDNVWIPKAP